MIEVEIQNFQSIQKATLKVDGFTGIQGRSNIGKSAIVRAIRCALTGAAGQDFVRHGKTCERKVKDAKKCKCYSEVRLECPDWKLVWKKGDSINQYVFRKGSEPERIYDSVSRGTPDFLLPDFDSIKVGDSPELLQVVSQFKPIFLLDQSGPAVADVLSDVAKLDRINLAMTLVNKDRKEAVSTRKVREKDIQSLLRALEAYKGLDSVSSQVSKVRVSYGALEKKEASVELLGRFVQQVQEQVIQIRTLGIALEPGLPDGVSLEEKCDSCLTLRGFCNRAADIMGTLKGLSGVSELILPDSQALEQRALDHKALLRFQSRLEELESEIEPLSGVSTVDTLECPSFGQALENLRRLEAWVQAVRKVKEGLRGKEAAEAPLPAVEGLGEKLKHLSLLERAVAVEAEAEALGEAYGKSEAAVQEVLEAFGELGVCPTCSQPVQAGRCTMGGHS